MTLSAQLEAIRHCADKARACGVPYWPNVVTVRTRTWSGGRRDDGTKTDSDLVLAARPVREVSTKEISSSGGRYQAGDIVVVDISPYYTVSGGGGYTEAQLKPPVLPTEQGKEVFYVLTGEVTGEYSLVDLNTSDPTVWTMVLRRMRTTP